MRPTNSVCPTCDEKINRLRNVPEFEGRRYCSSDCTIEAWENAQAVKLSREIKARLAAEQFGRGTEPTS